MDADDAGVGPTSAGEPAVSCRLPPAASANFGSAWTPATSCPVAFCMAARVVNLVPNMYIVPAVVSHTRLWSTVVVAGASSQMPMLPWRREQLIPATAG